MRLKSLNRKSGMTTIMTGIAISQKLAQDCEHLLAERHSRRYSQEVAVLLHRPHGIEVHSLEPCETDGGDMMSSSTHKVTSEQCQW